MASSRMGPQDEVMAKARAFMESRVILSGAELDLFTRLDEGPATAETLAHEKGTTLRGLARLLDALAAFGYLEKAGGSYRVSEQGGCLSSRHPETALPMVLHMGHLWERWSHLTETVRTGENPARVSLTGRDPAANRAFIGAMHVIGRSLAREIAASFDASRFRRLLDIGGASGSYTIAFLARYPDLGAVLFDLPGVIPLARERLEEEGLMSRVSLVEGDFYQDELPKGCDLALLSAIIHQNSPEQNVALYRKALAALDPGGVLLIRDHIMDETRTKPPAGAFFAINMLVATAGGGTYTFAEVREGLEEAGFTNVHLARSGPQMDCLVAAEKPR